MNPFPMGKGQGLGRPRQGWVLSGSAYMRTLGPGMRFLADDAAPLDGVQLLFAG